MINQAIIGGYLFGTVLLGIYLSRYVKTDSDFFLAGRSLTKWIIAGTIIATDVAAIYLVGPAGNSYQSGVPILLNAWSGNMIAAVSALLFVPRLRRLRITTISEILEERFHVSIRIFLTLLWITFYALFAGNAMYTFGIILSPILNIEPETVILFVGGCVILYCFFSGFLAVVYTDVIQTFLIILGGMILLPLSLKAVGGIHEFARNTPPEYFTFWRMDDTWPNYKSIIMFGLFGLPYWCTSQYMLQRCLAARSVRDASRGLMLAALLTGSITLAYIVPGICGSILYPQGELMEADSVLIRLFLDIMPVGLGGIFIAALLAANTSTTSSLLNSLSTLAVNDIFRRFLPIESSLLYLWIGRAVTIAGGAVGMLFAFNVGRLGGIIKANVELMSVFEPPIFVIIAAALFWRSANSWGAGLAVVVGVAYNAIAIFYGVEAEERTFFAFPLSILAMMLGSIVTRDLRRPSKAAVAKTEDMFSRMQGEPVQWNNRLGWCGLAVALASLIVMVISMSFADLVPRPANVLVIMGLVTTWVLGLYLTIGMFVSEEPKAATETEASAIENSWIHKIVGSGWSWAMIYLFGLLFMIVLYFI